MTHWEHVGILIRYWLVEDWTTITALHSNEIKVGDHFVDVLKVIQKDGWEMAAAYPEDGGTRFWFKRPVP